MEEYRNVEDLLSFFKVSAHIRIVDLRNSSCTCRILCLIDKILNTCILIIFLLFLLLYIIDPLFHVISRIVENNYGELIRNSITRKFNVSKIITAVHKRYVNASK